MYKEQISVCVFACQSASTSTDLVLSASAVQLLPYLLWPRICELGTEIIYSVVSAAAATVLPSSAALSNSRMEEKMLDIQSANMVKM